LRNSRASIARVKAARIRKSVVACVLAVNGYMAAAPAMLQGQTQGLVSRTKEQSDSDKSVLQVFLDGTIRTTTEQTAGASSATGALGFAFRSNNWQFVAQLNVASKQDTIKADPGRSILLPGTGGVSSGVFEVRSRVLRGSYSDGIGKDVADRLFLRGYISASSYNWLIPGMLADTSKRVAVATNVAGYGLGASYRVLDGVIGSDKDAPSVQLVFDVGVAVRQFAGDVMLARNTLGRVALVGSSQRRFVGPEIGATIQYNTIQGSIVYYQLGSRDEIAGLNSGQLAAGFSIRAPIFSGEYKPSVSR
jgi:hypothetical protein